MNPTFGNGPSLHDADRAQAPELSGIELRYGDLLAMLIVLGFRGDASRKTFNDYVKSLRRMGLPVAASKAPRHGRQIVYSYENAMDLVLALTLRVYHVIPDAIVKALVEARGELHPIYRKAYRDRRSGMGAPLLLTTSGKRLEISGVFLDLDIRYAGGRLLRFGPPQALTPFQAVERFARADNVARAFAPIPVSALAESVYELCRQRPGRRRPQAASDGPGAIRILAVLEEAQTVRQCLTLAAGAMRVEPGATLTALHIEADPSRIFTAPEEVSLQRLRVADEGTSGDRAMRVRRAFDQWVAFSGFKSVGFLHRVGPVEATLRKDAQAVDLIVVARPHNLDAGDALHAALFDTHKPVLFIPEGAVRHQVFTEHLAVVWQPQTPTRRALRHSMPWLCSARRVSIIPADEACPVDEPMRVLRDKGIIPEICRLGRKLPGEHAGAHILRRAGEIHASGLVMGAYRFGMMLEWLFDSTTNQIFSATELPLLVMH